MLTWSNSDGGNFFMNLPPDICQGLVLVEQLWKISSELFLCNIHILGI